MTDLAGDSVRPLINFSIHHKAAANAGSHDQAKHRAMPQPRAFQRFGQRRAIGIVGQMNATGGRISFRNRRGTADLSRQGILGAKTSPVADR